MDNVIILSDDNIKGLNKYGLMYMNEMVYTSLNSTDRKLIDNSKDIGIYEYNDRIYGMLKDFLVFGQSDMHMPIGFLEIGAYPYSKMSNTAFITLAVRRRYRNKGIGNKLIERLLNLSIDSFINSFGAEFIKKLCMIISKDNIITSHLAEKYGFVLNPEISTDEKQFYVRSIDKSLE